jgi:hypothetical protein
MIPLTSSFLNHSVIQSVRNPIFYLRIDCQVTISVAINRCSGVAVWQHLLSYCYCVIGFHVCCCSDNTVPVTVRPAVKPSLFRRECFVMVACVEQRRLYGRIYISNYFICINNFFKVSITIKNITNYYHYSTTKTGLRASVQGSAPVQLPLHRP